MDQEFDDRFKSIEGLLYLPWVGRDFAATESKRILIVAESVYSWEPGSQAVMDIISCPEFARTVISEHGFFHYIENPWNDIRNSKMGRNLERMFLGKSPCDAGERESIWTNVAFHELVQRPLESNGPQHRPSDQDYALGAKVLAELLPILAPKLVVFLSTDQRKVWRLIGNSGSKITYHEAIGKYQPKSFVLGSIPVVMIRHPSQYFSWSRWHEFVKPHIGNW